MEAIINRKELLNNLNILEKVSKKHQIPIISEKVLLEVGTVDITFIATDLEVYTKTRMNGKIIKTGEALIPIKFLKNVAKTIKTKEVKITVNNNKVKVSEPTKKTGLSLSLPIDPEEFPTMSEMKEAKHIASFNLKKLSNVLNQTMHGLKKESTYYNLDMYCIQFDDEKVEVVTTDEHRLSLAQIENNKKQNDYNGNIGVHLKTAKVLIENAKTDKGEIQVYLEKDKIHFISEKIHIVQVNCGTEDKFRFPNYRVVMPTTEPDVEIAISHEELETALKQIFTLNRNRKQKTILEISSEGELVIKCETEEFGEITYEIPIKIYKNSGAFEGYQIGYLMDSLKELKDKEIKLIHYELNRPLEITGIAEEPHNREFIMPLM